MKISRLFQIVYILLEKKTVTANELARMFEVSVRTIYRDIDTLTASGIPIYTSKGKGGGISLIEQFVLNKSLLLEKEQDEILFSLQSLSAVKYPQIEDILSKLSHLFQKSETKWIEVDFSSWGSDTKKKESFSLFKLAILNKMVVSFNYINSNNEKSIRKVMPKKLLFKDKAWYLAGYCLDKRASRLFKINRMSAIVLTNEKSAEIEEQEELSYHSSASDQLVWRKLILRMSPQVSYRIYDEFEEKNITMQKDGFYKIETSLLDGEWLYSYLLSFGYYVEVVEPKDIREELIHRAQLILNQYINSEKIL